MVENRENLLFYYQTNMAGKKRYKIQETPLYFSPHRKPTGLTDCGEKETSMNHTELDCVA